MSIYKKCSIALILFSFISGLAVYFALPVMMASHWNVLGNVDGYLPKYIMVWLLPSIASLVFFMADQYRGMDPLSKNYAKFIDTYEQFISILINFLVYSHLLVISANLGYTFNMGKMLAPAFLILFYYVGNLLDKAEPNWFVGIRNPWTISDHNVWVKTHRLGALLFKAVGVLSLVTLINPLVGLTLMIGSVLFVTFGLEVYSYLEYRIHNHSKKS